jgi:hypothetical protein
VNNGAVFEFDRDGLVVQLHQKPVYLPKKKKKLKTEKKEMKKRKRKRKRESDLTSFIVEKENEGLGLCVMHWTQRDF